MTENVRVAVRVRPFNQRETKRNAQLIIGMNGQTTTIRDPEDKKSEPRKFAFDFSYWSHNEFKERSDGYLEPTGSKYADQTKVFNDLGKGVLENAWAGYNTSLFAYGQTGSGKSYSMVGYGNNKGIVPLACEKLFTDIEAKRPQLQEGEEFNVSFSMLEIYNEQVRDLLNPASLKLKGGMKVRQHPTLGFYADGLRNVVVNTYKEIDAKINEGTQNRTVASTNMNATSSRAHTIVALKFTQKSKASGQSMTKSSIINLVDLAGSERADATGATGDRLKEGSAINQSLSTLGNVIKALADISGGAKKVMVPFRDSMLTKLLKNALGGNSKTIMIAALSPADINFEETLSTLRFADRAKAIKTSATINESPTEKLIRELREENQRLAEMLKKGGLDPAMMAAMTGGAGGGAMSEQEKEDMKKEMEAEIQKNQAEMDQMNKTWQEKFEEQQKEFQAQLAANAKENEQRKTMPNLWNLNEDPSLTGKVCHFLPTGKSTLIGKNEKAQIKLGGMGMQNEHAVIENKKDDKLTLKPHKGAKVVRNGFTITSSKELQHNDVLQFGEGSLFVVHHPKDFAKQRKSNKGTMRETPTFDSAQEEIAKNSGMPKIGAGGSATEDLLVQEDMVQLWPQISMANTMSEELNKKMNFEMTLVSPLALGKDGGRTQVCVTKRDLTNQNEYLFSKNDFIDKKFQMQEMYTNFNDGEDISNVPKEQDPFWDDPTREVLLGTANVYLMSLGYLMEVEETLPIIGLKADECGFLSIKAIPLNKDGKELEDEDGPEDPDELIGKALNFKLELKNAKGIPKRLVQTHCKFQMYQGKPESTIEGKGINPSFSYEKVFKYNPVSKDLVKWLMEEKLTIEVWGRQAATADVDSGLNTQELMLKDKSQKGAGPRPNAGPTNDHHYKMAAEANTFKRRMERAEAKLKKIQALVDQAKKQKKDTVKMAEVQKLTADSDSKDTKAAKKAAPAKKK